MNQRVEVLVIGAGPAGLSALFQAYRHGVVAVGIEKGSVPVPSISNYMQGLVLSSPAPHYEIAGIPLDCQSKVQVTKEELLHYYARIINLGQLRILYDMECVAINKIDTGVEVICSYNNEETRMQTMAVIFTAWYERKGIPDLFYKEKSKIKVLDGLVDPHSLPMRKVVIVGGGLSACESAVGIMMNGQSVTMILRNEKSTFHYERNFVNLLSITNSKVIEQVHSLKLFYDYIIVNEVEEKLECDSLIFQIGQKVNLGTLKVLTDARILTQELAQKIEYARTISHHEKPEDFEDKKSFLQNKLLEWPDLKVFLFEGVNRIFFAGGILHIGEAKSGVKNSIHTGKVAVDSALAKNELRTDLSLPQYLNNWIHDENREFDIELIKRLRPFAVRSWSRLSIPIGFYEDPSEKQDSLKYVVGALDRNNDIHEIMQMFDGSKSVGFFLETLCADEKSKVEFINLLYTLWYSNALTWFPPDNQV